MSILIQAVKQIQASDKHWLSEELQGKGIFSQNTIWHYQLERGANNCEYCKEFDGRDFLGNVIRDVFPTLLVFNEDYIWVNYHEFLWGKNTCKCFLYSDRANPETLMGENPP